MPLKTALFNKEIIKQDFRNVGWIGIVYFFGIFFFGPLQLFMELSREEPQLFNEQGLFGGVFVFDVQIIFLFSMPVLMAVFLFRYLHVKEASDFAHSFPMKRGKLFNHHIVSGLILLLLPIVLNDLFFLISASIIDVTNYYTITELGYWHWLMSVVTILIFLAGVFIGTLTGLSAVQGVLTYIFLLFPAGIYGLIAYHLNSYIKGFSGDLVLNRTLQYYSPLVDVVEYYRNGMGERVEWPVEPIALMVYGGLAVILYTAALILYKNRRLESASKAIAVSSLHPFFKYGVTFCFSLFGGMYFGVTQYSYGWMVTGYMVGGTFGYLVAAMLLEKTWRVFSRRHVRGWIGYGLGAGILIAILPLFWQTYETYIPEQTNIKQVYLGNGYYQYETGMGTEKEMSFISSPDAIEAVRTLHQDLIEESHPMNPGNDYFFFAYQLESGEEVFRKYQVDQGKVIDSLRTVYETDEYKQIHYSPLKLEPGEIQKVTMLPRINLGMERPLLDPDQIESFMEVLKADIYELSYEQIVEPRGLSTSVSFLVEGREEHEQSNLQLYPFYDRTMEWLKDEKLYGEVMIQPEDISVVEVYPWTDAYDYRHSHSRYVYDQIKQEGSEPFRVTEKAEIEATLQGQANQETGAYLVAIIFDENNPHRNEVLSFDEGEAPSFIEDHFN